MILKSFTSAAELVPRVQEKRGKSELWQEASGFDKLKTPYRRRRK
jgi:hypothetical protein